MRVFVTRAAFKDLSGISTFIAKDNAGAAARVLDDLHAAMRKLAELPGMGHQRADVANPSYRFWAVYSYLIAYRVEGDTLYISRVVHGARNLGKLFGKKRGR